MQSLILPSMLFSLLDFSNVTQAFPSYEWISTWGIFHSLILWHMNIGG